MHKYVNHVGRSTMVLALAARALGSQSVDRSLGMHAGRLPLIGPGTFLVAAYLGRSRLRWA